MKVFHAFIALALVIIIFSNNESFAQILNINPQANPSSELPSSTNNAIQAGNETGGLGAPCINPNANINPVNGLPLPSPSNPQVNNVPLGTTPNNIPVPIPGQNNSLGGNLTNPCSSFRNNSIGINQNGIGNNIENNPQTNNP